MISKPGKYPSLIKEFYWIMTPETNYSDLLVNIPCIGVDKDLLNSKTFNINDKEEINNLTVKVKLFNPENNQLIGDNNGKQQTTNQVSTETEAN